MSPTTRRINFIPAIIGLCRMREGFQKAVSHTKTKSSPTASFRPTCRSPDQGIFRSPLTSWSTFVHTRSFLEVWDFRMCWYQSCDASKYYYLLQRACGIHCIMTCTSVCFTLQCLIFPQCTDDCLNKYPSPKFTLLTHVSQHHD